MDKKCEKMYVVCCLSRAHGKQYVFYNTNISNDIVVVDGFSET